MGVSQLLAEGVLGGVSLQALSRPGGVSGPLTGLCCGAFGLRLVDLPLQLRERDAVLVPGAGLPPGEHERAAE